MSAVQMGEARARESRWPRRNKPRPRQDTNSRLRTPRPRPPAREPTAWGKKDNAVKLGFALLKLVVERGRAASSEAVNQHLCLFLCFALAPPLQTHPPGL